MSFIVTHERSGGASHMLTLVDNAISKGYNIVKVLVDGAYNARMNWNGMKHRDIEFITNIRRNASTISKGRYAERQRSAKGTISETRYGKMNMDAG